MAVTYRKFKNLTLYNMLLIYRTYWLVYMYRFLGFVTLWWYFSIARLAFECKSSLSVSNLKDTTYALGIQECTNGSKTFGTRCSDIFGAPLSDCILCVG